MKGKLFMPMETEIRGMPSSTKFLLKENLGIRLSQDIGLLAISSEMQAWSTFLQNSRKLPAYRRK
jgi:hypothetical protein